ncbi:MAG TPA: hypothetical protein VEB22_02255 [Phycisphaerales bacterium]|nr:hypothetical protein [Phycisphaerales bacterium]
MPATTVTIIVLIVCALAVAAAVFMMDWSASRSDQGTRSILLGAVPFVVGAGLMYVLRHWLGLQRGPSYAACFVVVWIVSMVVLSSVKSRNTKPPAVMTAAALQAALVCGVIWLGD